MAERGSPEVRASQLYDLLMDEFRVFQPSEQEAELCLCMMMASYLSGVANSDTMASMMIRRMGVQTETYYERAKRAAARKKNEERMIIKPEDMN